MILKLILKLFNLRSGLEPILLLLWMKIRITFCSKCIKSNWIENQDSSIILPKIDVGIKIPESPLNKNI